MAEADELLRHVGSLRRWCRQRTGDAHLAEDVTQETLLTALVYWDSLRDRDRLRGWLFRIAQRRLADHLRGRPPTVPLVEEPLAPGPPPRPDAKTVRLVQRALRRLPLILRRPVRMHYLQGRPLREVARALHTTVNGVKARLYRARQRLREEVR